MGNFISKLNWTFFGKIATVFGILTGVLYLFEKCSISLSSHPGIEATIQIVDYNLPQPVNYMFDYEYEKSMRNKLDTLLKSSKVSLSREITNALQHSSKSNVNDEVINWTLREHYYQDSRNFYKELISNSIGNDSLDYFKYWNLAILSINNVSKDKSGNFEIEMEKSDKYGGYYELEYMNRVIRSSYFKNIIHLPPLRGEKEYVVRIWSRFIGELDKSITISQEGAKIEPTRIIRTQGLYAWLTLHLNSFFDFYFILFLPLLLISWLLLNLYVFITQKK